MFTELKCPRCGSLSHSHGGGMSTLMYCAPYTDKDGVYHHNDLNTHTSYYQCLECHLNFYTERRGDYFKVGFYEEPEPVVGTPHSVPYFTDGGYLASPNNITDKLQVNDLPSESGEWGFCEPFSEPNELHISINQPSTKLVYNDNSYVIDWDKLINLGISLGFVSLEDKKDSD